MSTSKQVTQKRRQPGAERHNQSSDHLPGLDEAIRIVPAYELVVDRIRQALSLGTYLPGEKLPSERTIAEQLGVSRVTVREALRVLQGEHYLRMFRGASGGAVVLARDEPVGVLRQRMRERLSEFESILDFRLAVECAAARLAALNRTPEQLEDAQQTIDELAKASDLPSFRRADSAFHLLIGVASNNRLLLAAIQQARVAMFLPLDTIGLSLSEASARQHSKVLRAIAKKDAHAAERAMAAHIEATRLGIRSETAVKGADGDSRSTAHGNGSRSTDGTGPDEA